jgi:hypothetical protein
MSTQTRATAGAELIGKVQEVAAARSWNFSIDDVDAGIDQPSIVMAAREISPTLGAIIHRVHIEPRYGIDDYGNDRYLGHNVRAEREYSGDTDLVSFEHEETAQLIGTREDLEDAIDQAEVYLKTIEHKSSTL